ncbi:MAG TPA: FtsX-like permease family protein [Ktedonobacteraceae bacterium]|nr:FtsX-like permease family protein [Ktedonobacteraceae bacterium]
MITHSTNKQLQQQRVITILPIVTLALWQVRQTWRLLAFTGAGMIVATVLVCILPLYSQVALSAGLRTVINSSPANSSIAIQGMMQSSSQDIVTQTTQRLNQYASTDLTGCLSRSPLFLVQLQQASFSFGSQNNNGQTATTDNQVQLLGFPQNQLATHMTLVQGRLPQPAQETTEIALTPQIAQQLHLHVGDQLVMQSPLSVFVSGNSTIIPWTLRLVGLFTPNTPSDTFWQNNKFTIQHPSQSNSNSILFQALTSNEVLFSSLKSSITSHPTALIDTTSQPYLYWYYHLDTTHMDATHIASLLDGLHAFQSHATSLTNPNAGIQIYNTSAPSDTLNSYNTRVTLAQIPVGVLLLMVIGMVLLFIGLVTQLQVERRTEAIALLRSRGASRRQIFGAFTAQTLVLALLVLIIGPLLAIPLARLLSQRILSTSDLQALDLIAGNPFPLALGLWRFAFAAVAITLLASLLALFQATRFDTLVLRQEATRPDRKPLWQRFYLDGLLMALSVGGYGYALYANNTRLFDAATGIRLVSPLILASSALFLVSGLLLFLRFFTHIIQQASQMATRRRAAASMLALAQLARTPRQATRLVLLLTLTTAFAIFSQVFSASQTQRIADIANYEVGADFSARIADSTTRLSPAPAINTIQSQLGQQTASYRAIPGVLSASLGYMGSIQTAQQNSITLKAVDANTFAQTAYWSQQYSSESLDQLMKRLSDLRGAALQSHVVPALVDAVTWDALRLKAGQRFPLQLIVPNASGPGTIGTTVYFTAIARVQYLPTLSDVSTSTDQLSSAGILVDYLSCASGFAHADPIPQPTPISYVWLRTRDDAASLASVRATLTKRTLGEASFNDRYAFINALQHDPISLDLGGILAVGTFTPLFLAVIGSLLASWQSIRSRILNFVLLRALGTTPRQLISVISWEQSVIYLLMLALGIFSGVLLATMVIPALIVTSIASADTQGITLSSGAAIQQVLPPDQIIVPLSLGIIFGILILICILALSTMVRTVSRPSMGQALRLNAD